MTTSLQASIHAPCDDLPLPAPQLRVVRLEPCSRPGCGCQGHGALLLAVARRGASRLPEPQGCIARHPLRPRPVQGQPAAWLLWHGRAILELSGPRGARPRLASLRFDLAALDPSALSLACSDQQWEIAVWHQPPRLDPEEAAINALLPSHRTLVAPGTIETHPPVLVVQQDGSILSGLLARFFLLQLRRQFSVRSRTSQLSDNTAPVLTGSPSAQMAGQAGSR